MTPKRPSRISPEERARIVQALKDGGTVTSIAEQFQREPKTIRSVRDREVPEAKRGPKSNLIGFRLTQAEIGKLDAGMALSGLNSRSEYVRMLIRSAAGDLALAPEDQGTIEELRDELAKIGTNINQLARAGNFGKAKFTPAQWEDVQALRRDLDRMRMFFERVFAELRGQKSGFRVASKDGAP